MQLYELKEIQSEDDLPKEPGNYIVMYQGDKYLTRIRYEHNIKAYWMNNIHSYYLPVETLKMDIYTQTEFFNESWGSGTAHNGESIFLRKTQSVIVKQ